MFLILKTALPLFLSFSNPVAGDGCCPPGCCEPPCCEVPCCPEPCCPEPCCPEPRIGG